MHLKYLNLKHSVPFINMILYAYLNRYLIHHGNSSFQLDVYKVIRANHQSTTKREGVCIYYKESVSVWTLNLTNLSECIIYEVSIQNCKAYIGVIYRSPSQHSAEFEEYLSNFEDNLNTTTSSSSLFPIILGDFNARSSFWWKNDKTTVEEQGVT